MLKIFCCGKDALVVCLRWPLVEAIKLPIETCYNQGVGGRFFYARCTNFNCQLYYRYIPNHKSASAAGLGFLTFNFMNIKCKLGYHDWDIWQECDMNHYVFQKEKKEYRMCQLCYKQEYRPLPKLSDRMEYALRTRNREYIEDCFAIYEKEYGLHAFNKALTEIALNKIKIRTHDYKHEIRENLIVYYLTTVDNLPKSAKI